MRSERPPEREDTPGVRRRDFLTSVAAVSAGCVAGSVTGSGVASAADDTAAGEPFRRREATRIIANARKIVTPNGIERLEAVKIGGIEQWVSVRGADRRNPALLFLHGGPGYVSIPMSWWYTRGWEEYFPSFRGDQRGAAKPFLLNGPGPQAPPRQPGRRQAKTQGFLT